MEYTKLLEEQGLSEEQIKTIVNAMRKNRIFITQEEKIEERYQKMKQQRDLLKKKLELTESAIENAQSMLQVKEELQQLHCYYEDKMNSLKQEYEEKIISIKIDEAIKTLFVKTKYPELLAAKFDKTKVTFDSEGNVIGIEEQLSFLKREYKELFIESNCTGKKKDSTTACINLIVQTDLPFRSFQEKVV